MSLVDRPVVNLPVVDHTGSMQPSASASVDVCVLFAVDSTFPGLGGAEIQAVKLARALRERGVSVEFVSPQVSTEQPLVDSVEGFTVNRIPYPHIRLLGSLVLMYRFARYLMANRQRFDCVHIHVTRLLAATAGAVRSRSGLPVITKISGFFEFEGGVLDNRKRFWPVNFLSRLALRKIDYVQTISIQTREKLLAAGFRDEQICFVPNGIDTRVQAPPMPESASLCVGYCGRLREVKGVHVLLEAFARSRQLRPQAQLQLLIAGDGDTLRALRQQVQRLNLVDSVTFLGRVDDTAAFFSSIDIYVQPSFAEGLPNSVIEAMLASRPVLATDIGGNQDLVKDGVTGFLFPAGDDQRLSEIIVSCVDKREQLGSIGAAGRQVIVQNYGFGRVVEQLMDLYRGQ